MMDGGWGWGGWLLGTVVMIAFWALVVWAIVSATRHSGRGGSDERTAEDVLDERFARGEIDADEYEQRRRVLRTR
jgi:putative membrane protein